MELVQSNMTDDSLVIPLWKNCMARGKYIYNTDLTAVLSMRSELTGYCVRRVCLHVCPSVRMEQLGSNWMDSHEMLVFQYFSKIFFEEIQVI